MNGDSKFDDNDFTSTPYLKLIEDKEGTTCLCYQMRLHGKLHFVKKIKPEFENDARMRAAFRKENELGFSLSHPNIPRYVFMEGIFSPEEYVVMEWIEGTPLDKFIVDNSKYFSDKKNLKRFIYRLSDALDYLHRNGIIHGDLKPSNIMLSGDGERVMLLDLGYSVTDSHTLTGGFSPLFASPRVLENKKPEAGDDYYSFGKILEYIANHIEGKMPKEILVLRDRLTNSDLSKRIQTKEGIYKFLEEKRDRWTWVTVLPFLGLLVWFIIATVNKESSNETDKDINQQPVDMEKINNIPSTTQPEEIIQTEEPNYQKIDNNFPAVKTEISNNKIEAEKENIKGEVNRLLKLNYTPLINRIDSLTQANDFTSDWYFKIANESAEAMGKSIRDGYYYEKYPSVPKDEVIYIIANEFKEFDESVWSPKLQGYQKNIPR